MNEAPAISTTGLTRHYGERVALSEISFTLNQGQTLVVFGPNGAGKTTLLRVLATLLRPHAGTVQIMGCSLPGQAWKVRSQIGLLAHEPLLYRELSAIENLSLHARLHGVSQERVLQMLQAVAMHTRAQEPLRTLSRGMVQRVAIARSLLHDPALLLLDEPRANLDPAAAELVEPLIGKDTGRTRVLTSHDPAGGLSEADLVLGLRGGRVVFFGERACTDETQIAELYR